MRVQSVTKTVAVSVELTLEELLHIRYALALCQTQRKNEGHFTPESPCEGTWRKFLHETYGYEKG